MTRHRHFTTRTDPTLAHFKRRVVARLQAHLAQLDEALIARLTLEERARLRASIARIPPSLIGDAHRATLLARVSVVWEDVA